MNKPSTGVACSLLFLILCCTSSLLAATGDTTRPRVKPGITAIETAVPPPKETLANDSESENVITIEADRVEGVYEQEIEAIGNAKLCHGDNTLTADRMKYFKNTNETEVTGNLHLDRKKEIIEGSYLKLNLDTNVGFLTDPHYTLKKGGGRGIGDTLFLDGDNQYRLEGGIYTTCPVEQEDWFIQAKDLKIDSNTETGVARDVSIHFKGVPILYTPWLDFSYANKRKSGFLAPVLGYTARSGADLAFPIYLNIAPNMDATIAPRAMSKRGFLLSNEMRYIGHNVQGRLLADVLPDDIDTHRTRYGVSFQHAQYFGHGWRGQFDYNRVSDNRFLRDLSNNLSQISRTNLLQQAGLYYHGALGHDGAVSFSAIGQRFQTLQDPFAAVNANLLTISPYKRLPHITLNAVKRNIAGMDFSLDTSWTNFSHQTLTDGKRFTFFPTVSLPFRNSYGFMTPKFGLHYTNYLLSAAGTKGGDNPDRLIPIVSLDSGVVFDRNITIGNTGYIQTLEPRVFYVYIPFYDQSFLPNFDSAESDFSFAQMLTENRFSGSDRINDANQVTLAITSRLLEPSTGIERLRVAVGQQFRFDERRVILDSSQITSRRADFIAALAGRLTREISADVNIQLDQQTLNTEKIRAGISYNPEPGKVINLGYRFTRDVRERSDILTNPNQLNTAIKQVDTSVQWPFFANLHTVARINYSLEDDRLLAGLAGFEYISCCYKIRAVVQKLTTATQNTTTAVFVQLELNGLMNIGSNPLRVLQQSIPGYTSIY